MPAQGRAWFAAGRAAFSGVNGLSILWVIQQVEEFVQEFGALPQRFTIIILLLVEWALKRIVCLLPLAIVMGNIRNRSSQLRSRALLQPLKQSCQQVTFR
jgi:hypothetical protein